jgi:pyrroloquinoline quinone (PQQ) biosynthesis protein C
MFVEGIGWVDHRVHESANDVVAYTNNTWEQVALALGIERKQVLARKALEE